ncbi:MAG TPA: DUF2283 domain-containing protein [Acidimicrobiales bacterium]|nr:DUF2283 domain-containing protein [Acidimicrobiales bacterium]
MSEQVLYIYLAEGRQVVDQIEMEDGSVVDVDNGGRPVGVEVLNLERWDVTAVFDGFADLGDGPSGYLNTVAQAFGRVTDRRTPHVWGPAGRVPALT